jgi:hypothetical protein
VCDLDLDSLIILDFGIGKLGNRFNSKISDIFGIPDGSGLSAKKRFPNFPIPKSKII